MTKGNLDSLERLYNQYIDPIKPLLAEIEAMYERFPLALYNEIRALNDHVARAFVAADDKKAAEQIEKAKSHINRIIRDCYKFLNVYYKEEAEKFDKKICYIKPSNKEEFELMDKYGDLSDKATILVETAKRKEHLVSDEETYDNFEKAYLAYSDLHKFIVENRRQVYSMAIKRGVSVAVSVAFSIFTFVIGCIITNNNQEIINAVMNFFTK